MKKLLTILLTFSMILLMTSCEIYEFIEKLPTGDNGPTVNPDGSINYVDMTAADYDQINKLMKKIGDNVTVTVVSKNRGATLNAEYVVNGDTVKYTLQQLNMLPEDADVNKLPESMIQTQSGEARLGENGELVDNGGTAVTLPEGEVISGKFNFDENNFRNAKRSPDGFEGDVVSVSSLLGVKLEVDSMSVKVSYGDKYITKIVLTYVKADSTVTVTYEFN